jgi:hypothetical protein
MPDSTTSAPWNVRIPEGIAQEVRAALEAAEPGLRVNSIAQRNPELRTKILRWAHQAEELQDIETVSVGFGNGFFAPQKASGSTKFCQR